MPKISSVMKPPFDWLWLVVVAYFAFAHLIYPNNDVMRGNLPDPDNYMYLAQVLDWIEGQGWFDNVQHRMNPPEGVVVHFSRFTQMPYALAILVLNYAGFEIRTAAIISSFIIPLAFLALFLVALKRASTYIVPDKWAGASAYIALFFSTIMYSFMPGQVGHHGIVMVLALYGIGFIFQTIKQHSKNGFDQKTKRPTVAAGLVFAFALMIALEALPWLIVVSTYMGVRSLIKGNYAAKEGAEFGAAFFAGSVLGLIVSKPWPDIFKPEPMVFSITYVYLAGAIFIAFAAAYLIDKTNLDKAIKKLAIIAVAIICASTFLIIFPYMAFGPYGAIDTRLADMILGHVENAKPILETENGWAHFFNLMGGGSIAFFSAVIFCKRAKNSDREIWILTLCLQTTAILLTIFYQYRFLAMEAVAATLPLTAFLYRGWQYIGRNLRERPRFLAEILLLLVVGPLPSVLIPAMFDNRSFSSGVLLFPVETGNTRCDMHKLERVLNSPYQLGESPRLIITQMELGPEILFRTRHSVLAGPYHMNISGNVDSLAFLTAASSSTASAIAKRRGADIVIACRAVPGLYLKNTAYFKPFIATLFDDHAPEGFDFVPTAHRDNFVIYRVR